MMTSFSPLCRTGLFSAVIGDVMDIMGRTHQFLSPRIQPLRQDMILVGRAMPVLEADDRGGEARGDGMNCSTGRSGLMLQALDDLKKNEVYVCTGSSPDYALWGELMSTCAKNRGAAGVVVDGYSRDTRGILEVGLPVFSYGRYAQDQRPRGKVIDYRCTIKMGEVTVNPGDIIFGDLDGVCVIPQDIEREVIHAALAESVRRKTGFRSHQGRDGRAGCLGKIRNPVIAERQTAASFRFCN